MRKVTRRTIMKGGLSIAGALAAPRAVFSQGGGKTIKAAIGDITSFDPVVSTTYGASYHATMVYDTLFGLDLQEVPRPQMVEKYGLSDDKLTWTFELRDGLRFHDGAAVTSADVVPSIRRWAARDSLGQLMMNYVKDISSKDEKTFTIQLKESFGLVPDGLGGCFIMRKKEAETDPAQNINAIVGSGPFRFNLKETRPGSQYVYDRNPDYVPRRESPIGLAGGKVVKVDRVTYVNVPDAQTAIAALQAGEVDFFGTPPIDLLDQLSGDKNVKLDVLDERGEIGLIRFNFLHPPFNNVKCRQAILHIVNQVDYLKANFANPKYYKPCASLFACGTAMENDANTGWFKAAPDYTKAKQLLKEGGYDGRPVVLLQATSWSIGKNAAEIVAAEMRKAGINVQTEPLHDTGVAARRASKAPPDQGGWNVFIASGGAAAVGRPLHPFHMANGEKGWFGWPSDFKTEELRNKWALAETLEERKKIAREMQENAWNFVPLVWFGQWVQPVVMRSNIKGVLPTPNPQFRQWWNVEKT